MAADYTLDDENDKIEQLNRDIILKDAATYIVCDKIKQEDAIKKAEDLYASQREAEIDGSTGGEGTADDPITPLDNSLKDPCIPPLKEKQINAVFNKLKSQEE